MNDPLLQPLRIKNLTLRNRIMSTSHASTLDDGGMPKERYQRYHEEKAKGGIALTMFGGSSMVSRDFELGRRPDRCRRRRDHPVAAAVLGAHPRPWRRDHVPDFPSRPARRRRRLELAADDGAFARSARRGTATFPREMDAHDIDRVIGDYAAAAKRCQEGGLDGVETRRPAAI